MRKNIALASLLTLLAVPAIGQGNTLIDIQGDVKVINVEDLGLPSSTQASRVLDVLPELMARPGAYLIENFDVIVDGLAVGYSNDAVLSQLTVADIESITVSQNPIASYQTNGQSGSIEISLKSAKKGFSGNAALRLSNMYGSESSKLDTRLYDIIPKVQIDYVSDKYSLRGLSLVEYYNPMTHVAVTTIPSPNETVKTYDDSRFTSSMNVVWGEYNPTDVDKLNMSLAVMSAANKEDIVKASDLNPTDQLSSVDCKGHTVDLTADYRHSFSDGSVLRFSGNFEAGPNNMLSDQMSVRYGDTVKNVSFASKAEYKYPFRLLNDQLKGSVSAGFNANFGGNSKLQTDRRQTLGGIGLFELETKGRTSYFMPYVTFYAGMGDMSLSGYLNYGLFRSRITREQDRSFNLKTGSLTGMIVSAWEFAPGQKIRVIYDRGVQRPSAIQTYPYAVFDPESRVFVLGNGALKPIMTDELGGDFISQSQVGERQVVINMGLSYLKVSNAISSSPVTIYQGPASYDGVTFDNNGSNNIAKVNSMFLLKQGNYTATVTANMFYNIGDHKTTTSDHYAYCNLGINQSLRFADGWGAGLGLDFNSPIYSATSSKGKIVHSQIALSKNLDDNFSLEGLFTYSLSGKVTDQSYSGGQIIETTYPLVRTILSVVARYYF